MDFLWYTVYLLCFQSVLGKVTKKENKLLSRKKRYLFFPKGANFVYQFVDVKALMKTVPKGVQWLNEWDVPFPLPSDPSEIREFRRHRVHRRQVWNDLESALDGYGLNGTACVKRIICEAQEFIPFPGKSLVKDMLYALFSYSEIEETESDKYKNCCHISNFDDCSTPVLHLMLGSFSNY